MIKVLTLLIVLVSNTQYSQEYYVKTSHISDLVVQEQAILIVAARVPLPATISRQQGQNKVFRSAAPKLEAPIGRIDRWEYG